MTTTTVNICTAHNGTYSCGLGAGHSGKHETNTRPIVNSRNQILGYAYNTFTDNYSPVFRKIV